MAGWASDVPSKFKGRILSQEDLTVLEQVSQIAKKTNEKLKVYDVSRMTDKFRAMKRGIRKTPTVIINGEKYENLEEVLQSISSNIVHKS
ncbi:MAG: DsbA family protein [Candidatus Bathyarchaeota archaeon]|nr:DsbA family protein [Candidatus Bathyarchaeota archaeon]